MKFRSVAGLWIVLCAWISCASADFQTGLEAYQRGDYAAALQEWRPLAEGGDAQAQFRLGGMYAGGQGVPQDWNEAVKWYRRAAEKGLADAQYMLGATYQRGGRGLEPNYPEALKWCRARAGECPARARSGLSVRGSGTALRLHRSGEVAPAGSGPGARGVSVELGVAVRGTSQYRPTTNS